VDDKIQARFSALEYVCSVLIDSLSNEQRFMVKKKIGEEVEKNKEIFEKTGEKDKQMYYLALGMMAKPFEP